MLVKAQISDLPAILDLYERCRQKLSGERIEQWDNKYPGALPRRDIEDGSMYKRLQGDRIIGVVTIDQKQEEEYRAVAWSDAGGKVLVVHRMAVDPDYQHRGIGTEIVRFAEEYARQYGYSSIRLDAYSGNQAALNLYSKRGYKEVGKVFFPRRKLAFTCFEKKLTY